MKDLIDSITTLIPLLQAYPVWVKTIFSIWLFFTIILIIILIFTYPSSQKEKAQEETKIQVVGNKNVVGNNNIVITNEPIEEAFPSFINYDKYPSVKTAYMLVTEEESTSVGGLLFGPEYVWVGYEAGKKQNKKYYYGFYSKKFGRKIVLFIDINGEPSKRKITLAESHLPKTISIKTCGYHFIITIKSILEKNHETWLEILTFSEPGLYLHQEKAGVPGRDDEAWIRAH